MLCRPRFCFIFGHGNGIFVAKGDYRLTSLWEVGLRQSFDVRFFWREEGGHWVDEESEPLRYVGLSYPYKKWYLPDMEKSKKVSSTKSLNTTGIQETQRSALYLWCGLVLAMTLFYVQSQVVFLNGEPKGTSSLEWVLVGVGSLTFIFGLLFFNNYTRVKKTELLALEIRQRKQGLLTAFVMQYILLETVGLLGVFASVLTQNSYKAIPFVLAAYGGFIFCFPKKKYLVPFFPEKSHSSSKN